MEVLDLTDDDIKRPNLLWVITLSSVTLATVAI